jgi:2,3-bisphosphoglycerate-dependent phosphoglycerate mutase
MKEIENKPPNLLFVFLRHGQSTGNADNRHQGQADYPLTDAGILQAELLASDWSESGVQFDLAISSPQSRAKQTAKIITDVIKTKVEFDPLWMERDNGELAGLLHEEAMQSHPTPDFIPLHQPIANTGESQWELFLRAGTAVNKLVKYPPGKYLIISHGGFLNMVMHALIGQAPQPNFQGPVFRFSNTGYSTIQYRPGNDNWVFFEQNNTSHLDKK